jgi:hypothetical protein
MLFCVYEGERTVMLHPDTPRPYRLDEASATRTEATGSYASKLMANQIEAASNAKQKTPARHKTWMPKRITIVTTAPSDDNGFPPLPPRGGKRKAQANALQTTAKTRVIPLEDSDNELDNSFTATTPAFSLASLRSELLSSMDTKIDTFHKKFQADIEREISSTLQAGFDNTRNMVETTCNSLRTEVSALSQLVKNLAEQITTTKPTDPPVPAAATMEVDNNKKRASTTLDPGFSAMDISEAKAASAPFTKVTPVTRKTSQTSISAYGRLTSNSKPHSTNRAQLRPGASLR